MRIARRHRKPLRLNRGRRQRGVAATARDSIGAPQNSNLFFAVQRITAQCKNSIGHGASGDDISAMLSMYGGAF
jgi:hypothetical protein